MWTRPQIKDFKEKIRQDADSVITVGRGEVVTVRVPTHEEGSYLFWEFATDYYDIGFGVFFEWTDAASASVSVHVSESSDEDEDEEGEVLVEGMREINLHMCLLRMCGSDARPIFDEYLKKQLIFMMCMVYVVPPKSRLCKHKICINNQFFTNKNGT